MMTATRLLRNIGSSWLGVPLRRTTRLQIDRVEELAEGGWRGAGRNRTDESRFCRPLPYHLATAPGRQKSPKGPFPSSPRREPARADRPLTTSRRPARIARRDARAPSAAVASPLASLRPTGLGRRRDRRLAPRGRAAPIHPQGGRWRAAE